MDFIGDIRSFDQHYLRMKLPYREAYFRFSNICRKMLGFIVCSRMYRADYYDCYIIE